MFAMIPIKIYHEITKEFEDIKVSLVNLSPNVVRDIEEDKEDNTGIINYFNLEQINTDVPYMELTSLVCTVNNLSYPIQPVCSRHSTSVKDYLDFINNKNNNNGEATGD